MGSRPFRPADVARLPTSNSSTSGGRSDGGPGHVGLSCSCGPSGGVGALFHTQHAMRPTTIQMRNRRGNGNVSLAGSGDAVRSKTWTGTHSHNLPPPETKPPHHLLNEDCHRDQNRNRNTPVDRLSGPFPTLPRTLFFNFSPLLLQPSLLFSSSTSAVFPSVSSLSQLPRKLSLCMVMYSLIK